MSGTNGTNGHNGTTALAKLTPQRITINLRRERKEAPRYVDFHANATDMLCWMLSACGWTTKAIAGHLKSLGRPMTEAQVTYRIGKAEKNRGKSELTQRAAYRSGKSEVATAIVQTITARGSAVSQQLVSTLNERGLYEPRPTGVMRHDSRRDHKNGHRTAT
jgi:hypothetical protein